MFRNNVPPILFLMLKKGFKMNLLVDLWSNVYAAALLENFWRISLFVTYDAIAKIMVTES